MTIPIFLNLYFLFDIYYFLPSAQFGLFFFFPNSFRWYVRLCIWDFSLCLRKAYVAVNFPLNCFCHIPCIWESCIPIFICLEVFLNFLLISLLTHWLFSTILFGLCMFVCSCFCFYSWFLLSYHCNLEKKMFDRIS